MQEESRSALKDNDYDYHIIAAISVDRKLLRSRTERYL